MTNYFILIASDAESFERDGSVVKIQATDIVLKRLMVSRWPIYPRTRNRAIISPGDQCLMYVGGKCKNSQSIIASATVDGFLQDGQWREPGREYLVEPVAYTLILRDKVMFRKAVSIRPHLSALSFVTKTAVWGGALQGGCRRIRKEDFDLLNEDPE